jgi:hypothetical protein
MSMTIDSGQHWLAHLNRRAAHCRRLAAGATSPGIADELSQLAQNYEDEAAALLDGPSQPGN